MLLHRFVRGTAYFDTNGERWQIDRSILKNRIQLISDDGTIQTMPPAELLCRWQKGSFHLDPTSAALATPAMYEANRPPLSDYPERERIQAEYRLTVIEALVDRPTLTTREIESHCEKFRDPKNKRSPSVRTVRRWLSLYRPTRDVTRLVDTRSRRRSRIDPRVVQIIEDAIERVFLTAARKKKSEVVAEVGELIENANRGVINPRDQLQPPSPSTIFRALREVDPQTADQYRFGLAEARNRNRTGLLTRRIHRNLQRVELDHVLLDVILVDEATGLPLGRPWLTVAIDCNSRMIVGLHISFSPPSANSVLQCLGMAVLPKDEILKKHDIRNPWPACGIWHLLVLDNALEMHGDRLKSAALELGTAIMYCPSKKPWYKGMIERFNRTLNDGLIHSLPGTTFSNPQHRAGYRSKEESRLGFQTFEQILFRWILDEYHTRKHRTLKCSPLEKWEACEEISAIILPESPAALEIATAATLDRSVFHYGLQIDEIFYNSVELQEIARNCTPMTDGKRKAPRLRCKYYDHTVDHIDVFDPNLNHYVRVPSKDPEYTQGLNRLGHHAIQRHVAEKYGTRWTAADRRQVRKDIDQDVQAGAAETRRKRRASARHERAKAEAGQHSRACAKPQRPTRTPFPDYMRPEGPAAHADIGGTPC
jgi:putative transposase